ncbi:SDR family NAD(P)-dependent oxidoreductase [Halioxenophilus aromaticivorans]|uniref:SDR family oxidoreductase n=1 Tax=Halioxenophilus aromaticivorans TaxID=1306992 RepID=A0AAV3U6R0_9ALTE
MAKLKNKVALVTGAASGLGWAIAQRFAQEGATVIATDINIEEAPSQADVHFEPHDVCLLEDLQRLQALIEHRHGHLDILVNNAGITLMGSIEDISIEAFDRTLDVDVKGPFLGCKTMLPLMKQRGGSIINIASVSSFKPKAELVAYNTAKAGVALMTQSIALHCAQQGYNVRANYINPGVIKTAMLEKVVSQVENGEELMDGYKKMHPIGRIGEPTEIGAMATFLASDEASFITGCGYTVDGGLGIN